MTNLRTCSMILYVRRSARGILRDDYSYEYSSNPTTTYPGTNSAESRFGPSLGTADFCSTVFAISRHLSTVCLRSRSLSAGLQVLQHSPSDHTFRTCPNVEPIPQVGTYHTSLSRRSSNLTEGFLDTSLAADAFGET